MSLGSYILVNVLTVLLNIQYDAINIFPSMLFYLGLTYTIKNIYKYTVVMDVLTVVIAIVLYSLAENVLPPRGDTSIPMLMLYVNLVINAILHFLGHLYPFDFKYYRNELGNTK